LTAIVTALILFALGALLMRLLHITGGAVAVAGGIILAILAINMVTGPEKKGVGVESGFVKGVEETVGSAVCVAVDAGTCVVTVGVAVSSATTVAAGVCVLSGVPVALGVGS